jgi:hypothetical protein
MTVADGDAGLAPLINTQHWHLRGLQQSLVDGHVQGAIVRLVEEELQMSKGLHLLMAHRSADYTSGLAFVWYEPRHTQSPNPSLDGAGNTNEWESASFETRGFQAP